LLPTSQNFEEKAESALKEGDEQNKGLVEQEEAKARVTSDLVEQEEAKARVDLRALMVRRGGVLECSSTASIMCVRVC